MDAAIGMAAILVLQECLGNAAETLWWTVAAAGRQAGPRRVFSRAIAAIFPYIATHRSAESCNHACCRYVVTCYEPTCANAELIVDFN